MKVLKCLYELCIREMIKTFFSSSKRTHRFTQRCTGRMSTKSRLTSHTFYLRFLVILVLASVRDHIFMNNFLQFTQNLRHIKYQNYCHIPNLEQAVCERRKYFRRKQFSNLSRAITKPVFGVSDQVRHKLGCAATE